MGSDTAPPGLICVMIQIMIVLHATARFTADGIPRALPNPHPDLTIVEPTVGSAHQCIVELDDVATIDPGSTGPARVYIRFNVGIAWTEPLLIWRGREVGRLTDIVLDPPWTPGPNLAQLVCGRADPLGTRLAAVRMALHRSRRNRLEPDTGIRACQVPEPK